MGNLRRLVLIGMAALLLAACSDGGDPAKTMEDYWKARVAGDAQTLQRLSCPEWEEQAALQASSLQGLKARLEGMSCKKIGQEGDFMVVACQGKLIITYQDNDRLMDLGSYRLSKASGEWKVCGEAP